jgi:hypothetical protein
MAATLVNITLLRALTARHIGTWLVLLSGRCGDPR